MLPRVDLIKADEHSWLLLNSPDHISENIRKNGFWGKKEESIEEQIVAKVLEALQ